MHVETFYGGAINIETASGFTLNPLRGRVWRIAITTASQVVSLPDATEYSTGGPYFYIINCGSESFEIQDGAYASIVGGVVDPLDAVVISLADNSNKAGKWVAARLELKSSCTVSVEKNVYCVGGMDFVYTGYDTQQVAWKNNLYEYNVNTKVHSACSEYPNDTPCVPAAGDGGGYFKIINPVTDEVAKGDWLYTTPSEHLGYQPPFDTWHTFAAPPNETYPDSTCRRKEFSVVDNACDQLWIIGGEEANGNYPVKDTLHYTSTTDSWVRKQVAPQMILRAMCSMVDGLIYCYGFDPSDKYCYESSPTTDGYCVEYDPIKDSWRTRTSHTDQLGVSETHGGQGNSAAHAFYGSACRMYGQMPDYPSLAQYEHGEDLPHNTCPSTPNCVHKEPRWDEYTPDTDSWQVVTLLPFTYGGDPLISGQYQNVSAVASHNDTLYGESTTEDICIGFGQQHLHFRQDSESSDNGWFLGGSTKMRVYRLALGTYLEYDTHPVQAYNMGAATAPAT